MPVKGMGYNSKTPFLLYLLYKGSRVRRKTVAAGSVEKHRCMTCVQVRLAASYNKYAIALSPKEGTVPVGVTMISNYYKIKSGLLSLKGNFIHRKSPVGKS